MSAGSKWHLVAKIPAQLRPGSLPCRAWLELLQFPGPAHSWISQWASLKQTCSNKKAWMAIRQGEKHNLQHSFSLYVRIIEWRSRVCTASSISAQAPCQPSCSWPSFPLDVLPNFPPSQDLVSFLWKLILCKLAAIWNIVYQSYTVHEHWHFFIDTLRILDTVPCK